MSIQENGPQRGQTVLDPALIERIKALAVSRTRQSLNDRLGISYNTWRKLIAGSPVRTSLAARLRERVVRLEMSDPKN